MWLNLQAPKSGPAFGFGKLFTLMMLVNVESPHKALIFKIIGKVPAPVYVTSTGVFIVEDAGVPLANVQV